MRGGAFPTRAFGSLIGLFSQRGYLVESAGPARLLERHLPYQRLEDARLPRHIIATDMLEGVEIRRSSRLTVQAPLASAANPGVFQAVKLDGHRVVDCGVANHAPISAAVDLGATRLVVLPTGCSRVLEAPPLCPLGRSPCDFTSVGALIDRAGQSTDDWLRVGVAQLGGMPHPFPPHRHHAGAAPYGPAVMRAG